MELMDVRKKEGEQRENNPRQDVCERDRLREVEMWKKRYAKRTRRKRGYRWEMMQLYWVRESNKLEQALEKMRIAKERNNLVELKDSSAEQRAGMAEEQNR